MTSGWVASGKGNGKLLAEDNLCFLGGGGDCPANHALNFGMFAALLSQLCEFEHT